MTKQPYGPSAQQSAPSPGAARLAYRRAGQGEPLVLLHGQGLSHHSWDPIITQLSAERDVIAVDLPGHGQSPRQPAGHGNAPVDLAVAVAELLDELGLESAHVAGNSTGGWVALELGRLQRARTVTAVSPAGLWRRKAPAYIRATMRQTRLNARLIRRFAPNAPQSRLARALCMATASGRPFEVAYEPVHQAIHDMAGAPGFRETLRAMEQCNFRDGAAIRVPVTIAFGTRDRVLLPLIARRRTELPDHARWHKLSGCGHIAMFDDPSAVAALLVEASRTDAAGRQAVAG
jgi:pimeloyl-ACP methyl ester carboxylesterase